MTNGAPGDAPQLPLFEDGGATPGSVNTKFSDFVVYVDESGDHGMATIDANYPVFVLSFCVFHKRYYSEKVVPALEKFKFNHFGHDLVVLHEHEIRKEMGAFNCFKSRDEQRRFIADLTNLIDASNFILISCVIDKRRLQAADNLPPNPYHIALGFCLETLFQLLQEKQQVHATTHVLVECRGKKEDSDLELEFRRICGGSNRLGSPFPFDIVFADKKVNSAGRQLADLVARPIGLSVVRPTQENRAFEVLKKKFFCHGGRPNAGADYEDWGLKIFPSLKSEKPR
ncbi:DUF3800 domain-containing protein [Pseudoduganella sp.]|uniref:DUF3800 domain-containing protein n=1 Tax=Pseudoduganella sp. TaxID=1880898 RepID=UPI0035B41451